MIYRKSDGAFGMLPKKMAAAVAGPMSGSGVLPWKGELDTADRRLQELEDLFGEEPGPEEEERPALAPNPWREPM